MTTQPRHALKLFQFVHARLQPFFSGRVHFCIVAYSAVAVSVEWISQANSGPCIAAPEPFSPVPSPNISRSLSTVKKIKKAGRQRPDRHTSLDNQEFEVIATLGG